MTTKQTSNTEPAQDKALHATVHEEWNIVNRQDDNGIGKQRNKMNRRFGTSLRVQASVAINDQTGIVFHTTETNKCLSTVLVGACIDVNPHGFDAFTVNVSIQAKMLSREGQV